LTPSSDDSSTSSSGDASSDTSSSSSSDASSSDSSDALSSTTGSDSSASSGDSSSSSGDNSSSSGDSASSSGDVPGNSSSDSSTNPNGRRAYSRLFGRIRRDDTTNSTDIDGDFDDASDEAELSSLDSYLDGADSSNSTDIGSGDASDSDPLEGALNSSSNATSADDADDIDGATYISLLDSTGAYCLANSDDGNFYLTDASQASDYEFASEDNLVMGDGSDMVFFYYPAEMKALGASRFRMNDVDHIPVGADFITLAPVNADDSTTTPGLYVAIDSEENYFYLAACSIADFGAKVFLVQDPNNGTTILQQPELQYTITGGVIDSCSIIALSSDGFSGF